MTRKILLVILILIFSFEVINIFVSNTDLSGNYAIKGVSKIERRSIRLGASSDFGLLYPFVLTFQDLVMILMGITLVIVLLTHNKRFELTLENPKRWLSLSLASNFILWLLLNLQYFYRFTFSHLNEWSIYYLLHFTFMISLMISFSLAYLFGKKVKLNFPEKPRQRFLILFTSLFLLGLFIGFFDAFYTGCIFVFTFLDNILIYWVVMLLILFLSYLSSFLIFSLSKKMNISGKIFMYYLFAYFVTYATGLWFLSWHFLSGTLIPQLQHPLPFRVYPFAIYWESWMDYWLMVVSIVVFSWVSYLVYKKIKK